MQKPTIKDSEQKTSPNIIIQRRRETLNHRSVLDIMQQYICSKHNETINLV